MNKYEILCNKGDLALQTARNAKSNWARKYWKSVADRLYKKALSLNVSEL